MYKILLYFYAYEKNKIYIYCIDIGIQFASTWCKPLSAFKKLNQVISLAQELYFEDFDINEAMEGVIEGFLEELDLIPCHI